MVSILPDRRPSVGRGFPPPGIRKGTAAVKNDLDAKWDAGGPAVSPRLQKNQMAAINT
jgi:hypothetical protein